MKKTALFIFFIGQQYITLGSYGEDFRGIFELEDETVVEELSAKDLEIQRNSPHRTPELQKEKSLSGSPDFDAASVSADCNSVVSNGSFVIGNSSPSITGGLQKKRTLGDFISSRAKKIKNNAQA